MNNAFLNEIRTLAAQIDPKGVKELAPLAIDREARGGIRVDFKSREYQLSNQILRKLIREALSQATEEMLFFATQWWCSHRRTLSAATMKRIAYSEEAEYAALQACIQDNAQSHGYALWPYGMAAFGIAIACAEKNEFAAKVAAGE